MKGIGQKVAVDLKFSNRNSTPSLKLELTAITSKSSKSRASASSSLEKSQVEGHIALPST
jgi:hypothetical protein